MVWCCCFAERRDKTLGGGEEGRGGEMTQEQPECEQPNQKHTRQHTHKRWSTTHSTKHTHTSFAFSLFSLFSLLAGGKQTNAEQTRKKKKKEEREKGGPKKHGIPPPHKNTTCPERQKNNGRPIIGIPIFFRMSLSHCMLGRFHARFQKRGFGSQTKRVETVVKRPNHTTLMV